MLAFDGVKAFEFFLSIQSYWLQGFGGISGLDHSAVIKRIQLFEEHPNDQRWLLECIEALESGALLAWSDKRLEADDKNPPTPAQRERIKERRARRC